VIALGVREAEQALFSGSGSFPFQRAERDADALVVIAEAGDAVLTPSVGALRA
jgi:hypothetical protein